MNILNQHIEQIAKICESNGVNILFAFGSANSERFGSDSDIDFVVEIYGS